MIEALLQYSGNKNIMDIQDNIEVGNNSPMHLATKLNMIDVVDMFLQCGSDPTVAIKNGFTALHIAAREGYYDMCKMLVSKGKYFW